MAQHLFNSDPDPLSVTDLDANFTDLYGLRERISTPGYAASSSAIGIDSAGNVGIGTSTPATRFQVSQAAPTAGSVALSVIDSVAGSSVQLLRTGATFSYAGVGANESWLYSQGASNLNLGPDGAGAIKFVSNGLECGRFDSVRNFMLAGMTSSSGYGNGILFGPNVDSAPAGSIGHPSGTPSGTRYWLFGYNGGAVGSISQNGTTGVTYNTTSDYRLKKDPRALASAGAFIDALQPRTWTWVLDGSPGAGFLAHEFAEVCPAAVTGEKDAVDAEGQPIYQSMDASTPEVMANIIAELQSLRARVAALEAAA